MTRTSSKHKSHKHSSKHKEYSDSDEENVKMEKSSKSYRDSATGEKRKVKETKDLNNNGQVLEEYVSSKRRKEKQTDVDVGVDRWNGDVEKDISLKVESKGIASKTESKSRESVVAIVENLKVELKSKESVVKVESRSKSKRYETETLECAVIEKYESKKGESKRKGEKDSYSRKEKEYKEKERKSSKHGVAEDVDVGTKHDVNDDKPCKESKRSRSNTERATERNPEFEKESEKRIHKRSEVSSERDKHTSDCKEAHERRLSSKAHAVKETKYRDDKQKDAGYSEKHRDDKNRGDKEARQKDDRREDSQRELRRRDEKHSEDGERDKKRKDDKYWEGAEKVHRDDKYHSVTDREQRHKSERYVVDGRDSRKDERYFDDGERDDRRRYDCHREDGDRDNRQKDEKHRSDTEQDTQRKDKKSGEDLDRAKRHGNSKYKDEYEYNSRDRYGEKSDPPKCDGYAADPNSRKSSVYDDSSTHDDRTVRFLDDQARKKPNEKEDYDDFRYENHKDQRSNAEVKSVNVEVPEQGRSTSRNTDMEFNSSHSRRRNSPGSSPHDTRDHFRAPKQDESKYREINYEERVRHSTSSTREYTGTGSGGSEKTSPWLLDKHIKKGDIQSGELSGDKHCKRGDIQLGELSAERRLKSDIRPSSVQLVDKSPSSSADKRQFSRPDRHGADFRDANENAGKEGRTSRELHVNVINRDEFSKADMDTSSVSSPFARNSHLPSSKPFPRPPHFRKGMDSPLPLNSVEDDSRGKSNNRNRRIFNPNMGRMQGNAWRGMPSWPPPMSNGFLPFSPAPPPFMPFPSPPNFGIRQSMDLNHSLSSPYHSGQVHNMGWRSRAGDSFSTWDASNSGFGDESHNYGWPNWDVSKNLNGDLWTGQNRSVVFEMPSSDLENNSTRSSNEALVGEATKTQQMQAEEQAESAGISQSSRSILKADNDSLVVNQEEAGNVNKKGDFRLSHFYLSRLDISVDLVEPELFDKCLSLIDMDESMFCDLDVSKILCMEQEVMEAQTGPQHEILSCSLFPSANDTIFQKAMSLYKKHNDNFEAEVVEPIDDQEDQNVKNEDESEKLTPTDYMQGVEGSFANVDMNVNTPSDLPMLEVDLETSHQKIDPLADNVITEKSEEGESVKVTDALPVEVQEVPAASVTVSDYISGPFLNNNDDVSSEVGAIVIQESVVSNLSRIHHSPESTH